MSPLFFEALRIFRTSMKVKLFGRPNYQGNEETIAKTIIEKCFNGTFFQVSTGHFNQFYTRDFGMVTKALLELGYQEEVKKTIEYALEKFAKAKRFTTHLTPKGKPVNFPTQSPESASYILNSLILLNDKELINKYSYLFREEAERIYNEDINHTTGLLRTDKQFSSMKDHAIRQSSCYNNTFLGLFAKNLKKIGINSSLDTYNYPSLLKKYFWKEKGFIEDLSGREVYSADANIYPYWTGLITNKSMKKKSIQIIRDQKLDKPFPLKYTRKEDVGKLNNTNLLVPGYETTSIWVHLGMNYIEVVAKDNKELAKKYLQQYSKLIKKHKNFLEVYTITGKPFSRPLYESDHSMIWVAIYFYLKKGGDEGI